MSWGMTLIFLGLSCDVFPFQDVPCLMEACWNHWARRRCCRWEQDKIVPDWNQSSGTRRSNAPCMSKASPEVNIVMVIGEYLFDYWRIRRIWIVGLLKKRPRQDEYNHRRRRLRQVSRPHRGSWRFTPERTEMGELSFRQWSNFGTVLDPGGFLWQEKPCKSFCRTRDCPHWTEWITDNGALKTQFFHQVNKGK